MASVRGEVGEPDLKTYPCYLPSRTLSNEPSEVQSAAPAGAAQAPPEEVGQGVDLTQGQWRRLRNSVLGCIGPAFCNERPKFQPFSRSTGLPLLFPGRSQHL